MTPALGMKFLSCFGERDKTRETDVERGIPLLDGQQRGCIFCTASKENGFNIEWEDDELIAFHDRWPRATEHLLIIPRRHVVGTVPELRAEHAGMIQRMEARAHQLRPGAEMRLGFHIPPFSSVHHLHLHVLVYPLRHMGHVQYPVRAGRDGGKSWTWFVTPSQILAVLGAGGQVGLRPAPGKRE